MPPAPRLHLERGVRALGASGSAHTAGLPGWAGRAQRKTQRTMQHGPAGAPVRSVSKCRNELEMLDSLRAGRGAGMRRAGLQGLAPKHQRATRAPREHGWRRAAHQLPRGSRRGVNGRDQQQCVGASARWRSPLARPCAQPASVPPCAYITSRGTGGGKARLGGQPPRLGPPLTRCAASQTPQS